MKPLYVAALGLFELGWAFYSENLPDSLCRLTSCLNVSQNQDVILIYSNFDLIFDDALRFYQRHVVVPLIIIEEAVKGQGTRAVRRGRNRAGGCD